MYEELYAPLPDKEAYLERLKIEPPNTVDVKYLDRLIYAHQCYIPFENLDIYDFRKEINLGTEVLFEKVIAQKRGGYCFELNALFCMLLREYRYDAYPCASRILRGKDYIPPMLHRGTLVRMQEELWFCDVGYGGPMPGGALLVSDGFEKTCCKQTFRIERADEYWWTLCYLSGNNKEAILQFTTMPLGPVDFVTANDYCSRNENSLLLKQRMVNRRTPQGSCSVVNDTYYETINGEKTEKKIQSREELNQILKDFFGIQGIQ